MSIYNFAPSVIHDPTIPFTTWNDAFSEVELDQIESYCARLELRDAAVDGDSQSDKIRASKTGWIRNSTEMEWFYDRMAFVARQLNAKFYNFDLFGFVEDMQYTVYEGDASAHYTWHRDASFKSPAPRKLSLVLQLSDPGAYEGGELQVLVSSNEDAVVKQRGLIAAFPAWNLHRVTPVTSGIRKTIVVWVAGPEFK
jgi:PKHD-type hydroxylase